MLKGTLKICKKTSSKGKDYQVISFVEEKTGRVIELGTEYSNSQAIAQVLSLVLEIHMNTK